MDMSSNHTAESWKPQDKSKLIKLMLQLEQQS